MQEASVESMPHGSRPDWIISKITANPHYQQNPSLNEVIAKAGRLRTPIETIASQITTQTNECYIGGLAGIPD